MYIEYFLACVLIFMLDMRCQHVQQRSGRKSKQNNNIATRRVDIQIKFRYIVGRFYHIYCYYIEYIARPDTAMYYTI